MQANLSLKTLLDRPALYNLSQRLLGGSSAHYIYVNKYVKPDINDRILDIGCGAADILRFLPAVEYLGFDINPRYINSARKKFGSRGTFLCRRVSKNAIGKTSAFDIVLACGVLHHLDDNDALQLFELTKIALRKGGRLVTLDGCYINGQSRIAQYILSRDRGQHVRTKEGYLDLASKVFADIKTDIRHDMLRFPYTHIIMRCQKD